MSQSEKKKSTYEKRKEARHSPYAKGVRNENGDAVIRALTPEEQEFLEKFNQEFVDGTFTENNLHDPLIQANKKEIKRIKASLNRARKRLKTLSLTGYTNASGLERIAIKANKDAKNAEISKLQEKIRLLKDRLSELDIKANIYHTDYARSEDVMNFKNRLYYLEEKGKSSKVTETLEDLYSRKELWLEFNQSHLDEFIDDTTDD